jgi:phosphohistidine phosphatase
VLDLLRHGEAASSTPDGDGARPLTPRGVEVLGRLARHLAAQQGTYDRAFASPLLRARETADVVLRSFAEPPVPEILEELVPDAEPAEVVMALRAFGADSGRVLLVSHMPLLGDLTAYLCDGGAIPMAPGQLVRLEFTAAFGRAGGRRVLSVAAESLP